MTSWSAPLPLITCEQNNLHLNNSVAEKLKQIDKPLVSVCIAGPYRTGKSYLMNRLAGKQSGFALGSTVEALTKGIWVWYIDHPKDKSKGILLMDTEGLGDPCRGDETYDMWILCLSILLSSTFIYNTFGRIDNTLIDTLHFVADISQHIRVKLSDESDAYFDGFFPSFVLAIRDATLELKLNGNDVTEDEYMERMMLCAHESTSEREIKRNNIKLKLRQYFPKRKCFFFERPVRDESQLSHVDELTENQLEHSFLQKNNQFVNYVYENASVKKIDQLQAVNGHIFVDMTRIYLQAIQDGSIPCVGSAIEKISETENRLALQISVELYLKLMKEKLIMPVDLKELEGVHLHCQKAAMNMFLSKVFLKNSDEYHEKIQTRINNEYVKIAEENTLISKTKCDQLLNTLFEPMKFKTYLKPNGYEEFNRDLAILEQKYFSTPDKGVMSTAVMKKFLNLRKCDQKLILDSDEKLTEKQKIMENERILQEESKQKSELKKEELRQMTKHQEILLKSHQIQMENLKKIYNDKATEQRRIFEAQVKAREDEQRRLISENFREQAIQLQNEIDNIKSQQKSTIWRDLTSIGGNLMMFVPNPVVSTTGMIVSFLSHFF